jgi:hypothetical protein
MAKNYEGVQIADENKNRVTLTTTSTLPCRRQRLHSYEVDDYQPHAEFKGSEANNQQYEKDLCGVWKVGVKGQGKRGSGHNVADRRQRAGRSGDYYFCSNALCFGTLK